MKIYCGILLLDLLWGVVTFTRVIVGKWFSICIKKKKEAYFLLSLLVCYNKLILSLFISVGLLHRIILLPKGFPDKPYEKFFNTFTEKKKKKKKKKTGARKGREFGETGRGERRKKKKI